MQQLHLAPRDLVGQRYVDVAAGQIPVPLGDLVVQHELVAEHRRRLLGKQPVILVRVVGGRADDQIRREHRRRLVQDLLHRVPVRGQPPVRQPVQGKGNLCTGKERRRGAARLGLPFRGTGAEHVVHPYPRSGGGQRQQQPARGDLDVVGVCPDRDQ